MVVIVTRVPILLVSLEILIQEKRRGNEMKPVDGSVTKKMDGSSIVLDEYTSVEREYDHKRLFGKPSDILQWHYWISFETKFTGSIER